ncbi:MAG: amidase [Acidobacteria bacterium]|nr:amidase [Acidobacteriota bacterium]MBS1865704.1 amidase [Acidobacteriota bacterium]
MSSISYSSISQVASLLHSKQISPVELLDAQLSRISDLQPELNAFVQLDADAARAAARELSAKTPAGQLHAIPLTIKSCIEVANWRVPAGSLLRANEIPSRTAPIVERFRNAGAILPGSTNTPEFLMAYETDNRVTGRTNNPWNLDYSAGGSSGGEAAAIAAGLSFGGIGSDGGGSIRVPAHFCGICGLKPTPGRIPATGHIPPGNCSFGWIGVVGPMARTAADLRILFNVLAGPDPGDPFSAPAPIQELSTARGKKIRIGVLDSSTIGPATPESLAAVIHAGKLLEQSGFYAEPFELHSLDRALELWWFFFGPVIAQLFTPMVEGKESQLSPIFLDYLEAARPDEPTTMLDFITKSAARDAERARILEAMENVPVLLSPVSSAPAFKHGEGTWRSPNGFRETMRHSQWLNLAGLPGLSVPISTSSEGLPIGVQLIGRPNEEELLLAIAESLELARGPWQCPPFP